MEVCTIVLCLERAPDVCSCAHFWCWFGFFLAVAKILMVGQKHWLPQNVLSDIVKFQCVESAALWRFLLWQSHEVARRKLSYVIHLFTQSKRAFLNQVAQGPALPSVVFKKWKMHKLSLVLSKWECLHMETLPAFMLTEFPFMTPLLDSSN